MIDPPRKLLALELVGAGVGLAMPVAFWAVLQFNTDVIPFILSLWSSGALVGMTWITWSYRRGFDKAVRGHERERMGGEP